FFDTRVRRNPENLPCPARFPHELGAHLPKNLFTETEAHRDPLDEILLGPAHSRGIGARNLEEQSKEEDPALECRYRGIVPAQALDVDSSPVAVHFLDQ